MSRKRAQIPFINFDSFEESIAIIVNENGHIIERDEANNETAKYNIYIRFKDTVPDYIVNEEAQYIKDSCEYCVNVILYETYGVEYCSYDRVHFCFYEYVKEVKNENLITLVGNFLFDCTILI